MLRVANDLRWGLENELELERSGGIMVDGGWWMGSIRDQIMSQENGG